MQALLAALQEWVPMLRDRPVYRRENEFISDFVFCSLIRHIDPRRIGIEVAVPQVPGPRHKAQVRKDLVIWDQPRQTCFNVHGVPAQDPVVVLEWKARTQRLSPIDIAWLQAYTAHGACRCGIAIAVESTPLVTGLVYTVVERGVVGPTQTIT